MLFRDCVIITFVGTFASSLYLYSDQISQNWTAIHHGTTLSPWYLLDSVIDSSFGWSVNVIWPYIISQWISYQFGIVLFLYCFGIDELFRVFWFIYHQWFHYHQTPKDIYLCTWATVNDINTYIVIPIVVWMYHKYQNKHPQHNEHIQQPREHAPSHFTKIIIAYALTAIWFAIQDGHQYYYQNAQWSAIYKLPPFIIVSALFVYEKYFCKPHKNERFVHLILLCLFIMAQELLFEWGLLVYEVNHLVKGVERHVATVIVFSCYTIYFKILSFVAGLLTRHISDHEHIVFRLQFIFIVFPDVYLTLYLCASPMVDWTILYMIVVKLSAKFFSFNKRIQSSLPVLCQSSDESRTTHYVYAILASCVVYIGQMTLLLIDYFIYTGDTGWILSPVKADKTGRNLETSILLLVISLISELFAFLLVFMASKKAHSRHISLEKSLTYIVDDSPQYNIYERSFSVSLPITYFCFAVAYAQIASLNLTEFFPFLY
eukprot:145496_1